MSLFSKKEDTQYIKQFDDSLFKLNILAKDFRQMHFQSLELFSKNFTSPKTEEELSKEQEIFLKHLDVLQRLKMESETLIGEAMKLVRNENALSEHDRMQVLTALEETTAPKTTIKVKGKKTRKR